MARRIPRFVAAAVVACSAGLGADLPQVSADALKADVSFLASDALQGRATPSEGLDIAAEFIASQFRRAGLEPAGDGQTYFQNAKVMVREPNPQGFRMSVTSGDRTVEIPLADTYLTPAQAIRLDRVPVLLVATSSKIAPEEAEGKVLILESPAAGQRARGLTPELMITLMRQAPTRAQVYLQDGPAPAASLIVANAALADLARDGNALITLRVAPAKEHAATAGNVAGLLRGSTDEYVILSSHYDHVGVAASGEDRIFNGANDDASGSASVIEVANAIAARKEKPRRSILFLTFFGEERGLLGSRYYALHPLVPVAKTVGAMNLEQVGRTDASDGPQVRTASVTGFDMSTMPEVFAQAAESVGVRVYKNAAVSDAYFSRSDNVSFAQLGIPAHTLCVAFDFPDYHKVSDHWDKIDYANMAVVDQAVALGMLRLADDADPPQWNAEYAPAAKYREAAKATGPQ